MLLNVAEMSTKLTPSSGAVRATSSGGAFSAVIRSVRGWWAPLVSLLVFWWLATSAGGHKSVGPDELGHISSGYTYLKYHDFRLDPQNGLLPQKLAALPLWLGDYRFPAEEDAAWRAGDFDTLGYKFLFQMENNAAEILRMSRSMIAVLGALLGLAIYCWSKSIFGPTGGALSLALYVLCPTALSIAGTATSDMAAALFFTTAIWAFWRMLHKVSPFSVLAAATTLSGLVLSKMSAGLVVPMGAVLLLVRLALHRPLTIQLRARVNVTEVPRQIKWLAGALAVQALSAYVLVWAGYGFRYSAIPGSTTSGEGYGTTWSYVMRDTGTAGAVIGMMKEYRVLPEALLFGTAYVLRHSHSTPEVPRPAFLNGDYSLEGFTSYFPSCVLFKTPLGTFVVLFLAVAAAVAVWASRKHVNKGTAAAFTKNAFYEMTPLAILFFVYWAVAIQSTLNIGNRHIFPTYPPMFVFAGAACYWIKGRRRVPQALLVCGLLGVAVESFAIRPDYLSYFNIIAGGAKNGYKHLADSSIDWGQDLPALRDWLTENNKADDPVYFSYFGHADTHYYKIYGHRLPTVNGAEPIEPFNGRLTKGIYCVSVENLQSIAPPVMGRWAVPYEKAYQQLRAEIAAGGDASPAATPEQQQLRAQKQRLFGILQFNRLCAFLRHREPDAEAGYSIMIYRLTEDDLRRALDEPPAELLPTIEVRGYH